MTTLATGTPDVPKPLAAPGHVAGAGEIGPLSELEAALSGSKEQAAQAHMEATARLDSLARRTKLAMAAGTERAEFSTLGAVAKACKSAQEVLDMAATRREYVRKVS